MRLLPATVIHVCKLAGDGAQHAAAAARLQVYQGMLDAARGVVSLQGLAGLYSGLSVTLLEIVPYAALQFGLYDLFTAAAVSARSKVGCCTVTLHQPHAWGSS